MSVIVHNNYGFLVHPLPPTPHLHLQLISKPYGKHLSVPEKDFSKKIKKRKRRRTTPLNAGEASMMTYHQKVREKLLASWKSLVEMGKETGYFPVAANLQDDETLKTDATDAASAAMNNPLDIQVLDEDKMNILKPCLHCTYDSIDLADICNNNLSASHPRSPIVIDDDLKCSKISIDELSGRVVINSRKDWSVIKFSEVHFAIPQNCIFLLSDIAELQTLVNYIQCDSNRKYDCIILDPPWENRSAIRSHKYQWLSEHDLLQLPLPKLCNDGCLVVVWVTNKIRFVDFVRDILFPSWGVEVVAEWHWIKVTISGELVFDLESLHKKPYELLLLGRYQGFDIHTYVSDSCVHILYVIVTCITTGVGYLCYYMSPRMSVNNKVITTV